MNDQQRALARTCLAAAEHGTMTFPQSVGALQRAGFESYAVDFRRATATYYLLDGASLDLPMPSPGPVAAAFDRDALQAAIREAQQLVPGYGYRGFCAKTAAAGCAGYLVSFSGRRVLYLGRTAETHVERFPD